MGKRLDALLGRKLKTFNLKPTVNLALSRLAILKKQREARRSVAHSDVIQILHLGQHESALLRVEQVIKEQNVLDAFAMIESYCQLLIERVNLIEQAKECPDELKEAISSLLYAATRCGELPELQEIRAVFTSRFGREFAAAATELRNNCGVNPKILQKLSAMQPSLESKLKVLKEIASASGIILQIGEASPVTTEEMLGVDQKQNWRKEDSPILSEEREKVEGFSDSMKGRRKFRDVEDAAQAAFESAAYAAAAARAAVELSRSESFDSDDHNSPTSRPRTDNREPKKSQLRTRGEKDSRGIEDMNGGMGFDEIQPIQSYHSESEDEEIYAEHKAERSKHNKNRAEFMRSESASSSDLAYNIAMSPHVEGQTKPLRKEMVFDKSDDETGNEQSGTSLRRTRRVHRRSQAYEPSVIQK